MEKEVVSYKGCFVCGTDNPIGLNLRFYSDGDVTRTRWRPDSRHEGYRAIVHGGIIATILDEVMIKAALALGIRCVTASMEVRFKSPAELQSELIFEGRITERKGRIILTAGLAQDANGVLIAEATGKYIIPAPEFDQRLRQSLEE